MSKPTAPSPPSDSFGQARRVRVENTEPSSSGSGLALGLAATAVVPGAPLAGAALGLTKKRRGALSWAAVALGVAFTAGQFAVGSMGYSNWSRTQAAMDTTLRAGLDQGPTTFVAAFEADRVDGVNPKLTASFFRMLEHRYGAYQGATCDEALAGLPFVGGNGEKVKYTLRFAEATLPATLERGTGSLSDLWSDAPAITRLVIHDPEVGDIPYPPPARRPKPTTVVVVPADATDSDTTEALPTAVAGVPTAP